MGRREDLLREISDRAALGVVAQPLLAALQRSPSALRALSRSARNRLLIANSIRLACKSFCCNISDRQVPAVSPIMTFRLNFRNSMKTKDRLPPIPIINCKICTTIVQSADFEERVRAPYPTGGGSIAKPRPAGQAML